MPLQPAPTPQPGVTEFHVDCFSWFGVDFNEAPAAWGGGVEVARVSIDLAANDHLTARQLEYDPDPVTLLILARFPGGRLDSYTAGDCEFYGDLRYPLRRLGELALAAGAITAEEWAALVHEDELDLLRPPRLGPPVG